LGGSGESPLRGVHFVLNEHSVYNQLGRRTGQLLCCHVSTWRRIRSKFLCIRSTPTEMASTKEKLSECFVQSSWNGPDNAKARRPFWRGRLTEKLGKWPKQLGSKSGSISAAPPDIPMKAVSGRTKNQ
jgi:hypothetical protein